MIALEAQNRDAVIIHRRFPPQPAAGDGVIIESRIPQNDEYIVLCGPAGRQKVCDPPEFSMGVRCDVDHPTTLPNTRSSRSGAISTGVYRGFREISRTVPSSLENFLQ